MPRSFHHRDFADLPALVAAKEAAGLRVSLCIPTLNEEGTVARVVSVLKTALFDEHRLLDELVVIDSGSTDRTRTLAAEGVDPRGGGRVTEILVRPLLQRFFPELAGLHQPLAGEYAARRELLEQFAMPTGYGVEIAHLLDCHRLHGAGAIGQTDLDERIHRNRSLAQLGRMSGEILDAFFARHPQPVAAPGERPPMISLPEYRERFPATADRARNSA